MARVLIENYRGFEIEFDTDSNKFNCIVTDEDFKESNSFLAVRKFIDDYKSNNKSFKPFYIIPIPGKSSKNYERIKVVGLRKDGLFIVEKNNKNECLGKYNNEYYMIDCPENLPIINNLEDINELEDKLLTDNRVKRDELIKKLKIITLVEYKKQLVNL